MTTATPATAISARMRFRTTPPSAGDDEREDEPEQRERLGERDPEEHRGSDGAGRLGLARHGGDRVADDQADADAGADGGAAVDDASTDRGQPLGGVGSCLGEEEMEQSHVGSPCCFFFERVVDGQCEGCMELSMYTAVRIVKMNACRKLTRISKPVIATSSKNENGMITTVTLAANSAAHS